jgi:hypothetical protein
VYVSLCLPFEGSLEVFLLTDDLADDDEEIENPDGIHFDIGHDFVRAVMDAPLGSLADEGKSSIVLPGQPELF